MCRGMPPCPWDTCGGASWGGLVGFLWGCPAADRAVASGVGHDAVVGAAGAGAAGAGAVAGEHLRGGPAVEFHQVSLGPAAVQPGVAEMVPEPVRVHRHAALAAAAADHLVNTGSSQRLPVVHAQPRLVPPGLGVPSAGTEVPVQAAGRLVADLDDAVLAALAADGDLPLPQVDVAAPRVTGVVAEGRPARPAGCRSP